MANNMGSSIEMIKRNYTDRKDKGFDVDILEEPNKKQSKKKK